MLYAVICTDKPGALETRKATRREHLEHLKGLGGRLKLAGPFLTEDGSEPRGSLLVIEGESLAEVRKIADADPYAKAGVFQSVDIRPWTVVLGGIAK
ncbi:MAG: YciI family protein [Hyphomicrobiaceae bacterium]